MQRCLFVALGFSGECEAAGQAARAFFFFFNQSHSTDKNIKLEVRSVDLCLFLFAFRHADESKTNIEQQNLSKRVPYRDLFLNLTRHV